MATSRPVSYKWVLIRAGVIFGMNLAMRILLADPLQTNLSASFPAMNRLPIYTESLAFASFFVGGVLVGYFSPASPSVPAPRPRNPRPAAPSLRRARTACVSSVGPASRRLHPRSLSPPPS